MPGLLQRLALSCLFFGGAVTADTPPPALQRLQVERLPVNGALTQNTISDMLQDRSGLMWVASSAA